MNADLILKKCQLDKIAKFKEIKINNPKLN